jgi:hypothetical protein
MSSDEFVICRPQILMSPIIQQLICMLFLLYEYVIILIIVKVITLSTIKFAWHVAHVRVYEK